MINIIIIFMIIIYNKLNCNNFINIINNINNIIKTINNIILIEYFLYK